MWMVKEALLSLLNSISILTLNLGQIVHSIYREMPYILFMKQMAILLMILIKKKYSPV